MAQTATNPQTGEKVILTGEGWKPFDEKAFQQWYGKAAADTGISPNPDDPEHYYDYRGAYASGVEPPTEQGGHWPSQFKSPGHPNRYVDGIDTISGKPAKTATNQQTGEKVFFDEAAGQWKPLKSQPAATPPAPAHEMDNQWLEAGDIHGGAPTDQDVTAGRFLGSMYQSAKEGVGKTIRGLSLGVEHSKGLADLNPDAAIAALAPSERAEYGRLVNANPDKDPRQVLSEYYDSLAKEKSANLAEGAKYPGLQIPEEYKQPVGNKAYQFIEESAKGMAAFAPGLALTAVSPGAGFLSMFEQIRGSEYDEMISKGVDPDRAFIASSLSSLGQAPLESVGSIVELGIMKKMITGKAGQFILSLVQNAAAEGLENGLQKFPEMMANVYAANPDLPPEQIVKVIGEKFKDPQFWKEVGYDTAQGAAGGFMMAAGGKAASLPFTLTAYKSQGQKDIDALKQVDLISPEIKTVKTDDDLIQFPAHTDEEGAQMRDEIKRQQNKFDASLTPVDIMSQKKQGVGLQLAPEPAQVRNQATIDKLSSDEQRQAELDQSISQRREQNQADINSISRQDQAKQQVEAVQQQFQGAQPPIPANALPIYATQQAGIEPGVGVDDTQQNRETAAPMGLALPTEAPAVPPPATGPQMLNEQPKGLELAPPTAVPAPGPSEIDVKAHEAATSPTNDLPEPTDAQKSAGVYQKGHIKWNGLDISVENPEGSTRTEKKPEDANDDWEPSWSSTMTNAHYGYFRGGKEGADGDAVDTFVAPGNQQSDKVFVIDQVNPETGKFDESKIMVGYPNEQAAREAYLANYEKGWQGLGAITEMGVRPFKKWLKEGDHTKSIGDISRAQKQQILALPAPQTVKERIAQIQKNADIRKSRAKQIADSSGKKPVVLVQNGERLMGVIIHKSTKAPGKYQVTTWDEKGFIGDSQYKSLEEAVYESLRDGFTVEDRDTFNRVVSSRKFDKWSEAFKRNRANWDGANKGEGVIELPPPGETQPKEPPTALKYDGPQDRTAINKPPLHSFTPYDGPVKGMSFSLENPSPEAIKSKIDEMVDTRAKLQAKLKEQEQTRQQAKDAGIPQRDIEEAEKAGIRDSQAEGEAAGAEAEGGSESPAEGPATEKPVRQLKQTAQEQPQEEPDAEPKPQKETAASPSTERYRVESGNKQQLVARIDEAMRSLPAPVPLGRNVSFGKPAKVQGKTEVRVSFESQGDGPDAMLIKAGRYEYDVIAKRYIPDDKYGNMTEETLARGMSMKDAKAFAQAYLDGMMAPHGQAEFITPTGATYKITRSHYALERFKNQTLKASPAPKFSRRNPQTETEAFKRWFGRSVVTEDGKPGGEPRVVYHGTQSNFDAFDKRKAHDKEGKSLNLGWGRGVFYFSKEPRPAENFALRKDRGKGYAEGNPSVMPVYLKVETPFDAVDNYGRWQRARDGFLDKKSGIYFGDIPTARNQRAEAFVKQLKKEGYDGILFDDEIAVFEPTQIKSSTGNNGYFSPNNPSILYSMRPPGGKGTLKTASVQKTISDLTKNWTNAPKIEVVQSQSDLPGDILDHLKNIGAENDIVDGTFYQGTVYLVSDNLASDQAAALTVLHESFGHYGLRELLGRSFRTVLKQVYEAKKADIEKVAKEYGFDLSKSTDQILAADEWLSRHVSENKQSTWIDKIISAIRAFIRKLNPNLKFSDTEIRSLLDASRSRVMGTLPSLAGVGPGASILDPAFSMSKKKDEPKRTIKAYKLFRTLKGRPGEIFPLFIGKTTPTPIGQWLKAEFIPTKGYAQRPGWHAGVLPTAPHLMKKDGTMPSDRVWAEVEIPADVDWQPEADESRTRDIRDKIPAGGHYKFKTNKMQGGAWIIGGSIKVNRLLTESEVSDILEAGEDIGTEPAFKRTSATPTLPPTPFSDENRRIREQDKTLWERAGKIIKRQLAPGGLLPKAVFDEQIKRDSEFNVIEYDVKGLISEFDRAIEEDYGIKYGNLSDNDKKALSDALTGTVTGVRPKTSAAIVAMRNYIDGFSREYSQILADQAQALLADGKNEAAVAKVDLLNTIINNMGQYVHRSYQAFDDPNWFKKVPEDVLDKAKQYLHDRYVQAGETDTEATRLAAVKAEEILKSGTAYDSLEGMIKESKLGAKDLSVLKQRKKIAPEIRALLGEYTDPRINFVKSATKMGHLIFNHRFLEEVRRLGMGEFLFEDKDKPLGATKQIAAEGSEVYSPLNGLWTTPEIERSFKDALGKEQMANWYRKVIQINGAIKFGKTILSPTTAMRNWQSALLFSMANGHFNLLHMDKSLSGLKDYFTNAGRGARRAYMRNLIELGVLYDTPYAGEMMRLLEDTLQDRVLFSPAKLGARAALDYAQKFYQFGDDFWKIIGFENEKSALIKSGMTAAEAEKESAKRIRDTYPTYSMVGRFVKSLRRFPLAGTFVSFPAEIIRTSANMVKYAAIDMKAGRKNLAMKRIVGMIIAGGFAHAWQKLSKLIFGVSDDEEEAVRILSPPWSQNSNLAFTGRDKDGNMTYFDLSFIDPYNYWKRPVTALLRDQPWEKKMADVLYESLNPFFGTDITAQALFEVISNKKETGGKVWNETDSPVDNTIDIAKYLTGKLSPGFISNLERTYKAIDGQYSPSGKKYDLKDEMAAFAGWRTTTLDPKTSLYYRSFDFKDQKIDALKPLRRALTSPNDVSDGDLKGAYEQSMRNLKKVYGDMQLIVKASEKNGFGRRKIFNVFENSGLSDQDKSILINGAEPKWTPSITQILNDAQKAEMIHRGAAKEISQRYKRLAQIIGKEKEK